MPRVVPLERLVEEAEKAKEEERYWRSRRRTMAEECVCRRAEKIAFEAERRVGKARLEQQQKRRRLALRRQEKEKIARREANLKVMAEEREQWKEELERQHEMLVRKAQIEATWRLVRLKNGFVSWSELGRGSNFPYPEGCCRTEPKPTLDDLDRADVVDEFDQDLDFVGGVEGLSLLPPPKALGFMLEPNG